MIQFDEHIFQMGWFNHQPVGFFFVPHEIKIPVIFQVGGFPSPRTKELIDPED